MVEDKKNLLILFGGRSSEHEVSCKSAASILENINREKYDIRVVGITKEGKWLETSASPEKIAKGVWIKKINNREVYISYDPEVKGLRTLRGKELKVDCVFPILHGRYGEDGSMQGLIDISGIPYVGSKVLASACAMDKGISKKIVDGLGIGQAKYYVTDRYSFSTNPAEELKEIERIFKGEYPLFVKPANTGSSIGISRVTNQMELFEGIKVAAEEDHKIVIEEEIVGRELEVGVLGNRNPHASPIGEIITGKGFYDYDAKYNSSASITEIVKDLTPTKEKEIKETAVEIYKVFGCRGLARVDFFLTKKREVIFNEINTIPGFTKISMYPKLWEAANIPYSELIDRLIELAIEED